MILVLLHEGLSPSPGCRILLGGPSPKGVQGVPIDRRGLFGVRGPDTAFGNPLLRGYSEYLIDNDGSTANFRGQTSSQNAEPTIPNPVATERGTCRFWSRASNCSAHRAAGPTAPLRSRATRPQRAALGSGLMGALYRVFGGLLSCELPESVWVLTASPGKSFLQESKGTQWKALERGHATPA